MIEKLFVYGTLGPGRQNEHVLGAIDGSWETATVTGTLRDEGWGAKMGYPGIDLDDHGSKIEGFIFTSENLSTHWESLDAFEGEAYRRVSVEATLKNGVTVNAYIYALPQLSQIIDRE